MITAPNSSYVALFRGINVGGKNILPMKELAAIFANCGCTGVKTYIQSGNVIFCADTVPKNGFCEQILQQIEKKFGHKPPVVLRSREQMAEVVRKNPYAKPGVDEKSLHVVFLLDKPKPQDVAKLDPNRSPGDEFTVIGQEIYLRLGNGMANTKLTSAYIDSRLGTIGTARNWRTVQTLLEMMSS